VCTLSPFISPLNIIFLVIFYYYYKYVYVYYRIPTKRLLSEEEDKTKDFIHEEVEVFVVLGGTSIVSVVE